MSKGNTVSVEAVVDAQLERCGLRVEPEERQRLVRLYPFVEQMRAALRLAETRYGEPAIIYPAAPARSASG